jgi:type II secretory pathway component PulM
MATTTIEKIKAWTAPILFSSVTWLLWQDISEMKSDVKKLLSESEYKRAVIETLKDDVNQLKQSVFYNKKTTSLVNNKQDVYFINEETYRLKKRIKIVV